MKNITLICIIFLMTVSGCTKEFLDREPIDFLAPDNFKTETDIREAVNGIYRAYISDKNDPIYTDFIVDNGYFPDYRDMWNRTYNNETVYVVNKWTRDYKVVLTANTVLKFIDQVKLSDKAYAQYKGEATFMRALAYADLSFFFGSVPMRLQPEGLDQADKAVTAKDEVVRFVLDELETAANLLPVSYAATDKGRATKGAALAIKARVLLYNKRYAEAADYCKKVKALNYYKIMPEYKNLFLPESEADNLEVIFDMQYQTNALPQGLSNPWYERFYLFSGYQVSLDLYDQYYSTNGLSIYNPANTLYNPTVRPAADLNFPSNYARNGGLDNRFQNRDPRMNFSIVVPYSIDSYDKVTKAPGIYYPTDKKTANLTSFRVKKYVDYNNASVAGISGVNPSIIRYADILLMEAEALVELGGYDENYVYGLINQVRQRPSVMMPKVETVEGKGLSPLALKNVIRHERRVEFAFEGLRIFDVIRWQSNEVFTDLRGFDPSKLTRTVATGIVYTPYTALVRTPFDPAKGYQWPIPKTEVDANKLIK